MASSTSTTSSENEKVSTLIIGSGPTGLGSAIRLTQICNSRDWLIIDKEVNKVGGLSQSDTTEEDFVFDVGGHVIFSHYKFFDELLDNALSDSKQWQIHQRISYARYKQIWVPYPFQNNLHYLPIDDQIKCINGLIEAKVNYNNKVNNSNNNENGYKYKPSNFDEWIVTTMGIGLAEVFMRPYNLKVWGYYPNTMQCDWLGERVSVVNVEKVIENVLRKKDDTSWGPNAVFRFPTNGGTGSIWESVYEQVPLSCKRKGCEVISINIKEKYVEIIDHLDKINNLSHDKMNNKNNNGNDNNINGKYENVANEKKRHIYDDNTDNNVELSSSSAAKATTKKIYYDKLVTTMPLDICLRSLKGLNEEETIKANEWANKLVHSSTHIIGIGFRGESPHGKKCWLYFPGSECPYYRATIFSNYAPGNCPPSDKLLPTIRVIGKENETKQINNELKPGPYWSLMLEVVETEYLNKGITKEQVIEECIKGCIATSLAQIGDEVVSIYHKRIEYGYPTPSLKRDEALNEALPFLDKYDIYSRGRFGSYKYEIGNQDHSVALGVEVIDRILLGKPEVTLNKPNEVNKPNGIKNENPKYCLGKWDLD